MQIYASVVEKTPVKTGRARGNWHASKGSAEQEILERETHTPLSEEMAVIQSSKGDETIYIQNNLPYINRLEYGYSTQAPQGMVRLTMQEVESFIKNAVKGKK